MSSENASSSLEQTGASKLAIPYSSVVRLDEDYYLSYYEFEDVPHLIELLNVSDIYARNLLSISYPYSFANAIDVISRIYKQRYPSLQTNIDEILRILSVEKYDMVDETSYNKALTSLHEASQQLEEVRCHHYCIRSIQLNHAIVGSIGIHAKDPGNNFHAHICEMGYWLAVSHHGQGILPRTIRALLNDIFNVIQPPLKYTRVVANIFSFNTASERALVKAGFILEGYLRKHYFKNSHFIDSKCYAILKEDFNEQWQKEQESKSSSTK